MIDDQEDELTYKEFMAFLINALNHQDTPQIMWMITRDDIKQERLAEADRLFKKWKKTELTADRAREALRRLI